MSEQEQTIAVVDVPMSPPLGTPRSPRGPSPVMPPEVEELLSPLFGADSDYLAAAFDAIESTWGSTETYLTEGLGLTPATREKLRAQLLTD